ncbi:glycosyltransferase [Halomonas organivorans]|uniref:MGT family glycosyltransferase n=1 Tax=Halomonas organivorans TaxID=257772 RepID=A0A7W5G774_9GAMM|nr:nucleotide disphospho-sugar-binding domain-containing protein [Halomonas organivorans]MBB3142637.1 MGT family glycosyltransferase [Halomonas organivorans]
MRILFLPLGWVLAHTARCIEIAKVLRQRGHEVVFAGDDPRHPASRLSLVEQAGFRLVYAREPDLPYAWERYKQHGWRAAAWDLAHLRQWAPLGKIIEGQLAVIERERPDLVVGDASVSASTAAYIAGVPVAGIMNAYAARLLTPRSPLYLAARGFDRISLSRFRRRVFHRHGVPEIDALALLHAMPMLSPDLPGLYPMPARFRDYHMVGPIFPDHPAPLPDWYDELDDGTPNVYITMGSTGMFETFLKAVYPRLSTLPYRFIVTTGGQVSQDVIDAAPANFRLTDYAPGSALLAHCRAMIFHGGNGTFYQALAAGVPMLALPSHYEQRLSAQIAVRHGVGLRMKARRFSVDRLVTSLTRLVEEPRFADAAARLAPQVRDTDGAANAADILERIAREGRPAGICKPVSAASRLVNGERATRL